MENTDMNGTFGGHKTEGIRDKEQRWQEMYTTVANIRDALGKKVDPGIIETVVVLNLLGMPTTMSCEGHLERAAGAPWVHIADTSAIEHSNEVQQMFQQAGQLQQQAQMTDKVAHLLEEAWKAEREVKRLHLAIRRKLLDYLAMFYENRHVPFDIRLIIQSHGMGRSRLESQGADFQDIAPPEERRLNLIAYQEEMRQFTLFLKQQYFQITDI